MARTCLYLLAAAICSVPAAAAPALGPATASLTPADMFALADAARSRADRALAEQIYRALAANPDLETRTEARFRLGMMLADELHRPRDAALEFRRILDEKPRAARVRLELARMDALLGRTAAATGQLQTAAAGGLPPEVERTVRFYAAALTARRRSGASVELALAPDSNVNRASRATTLGTIFGDFTLDAAARARSGLGLALGGQGFVRVGPSLLVEVDGQGRLYRQSTFDDVAMGLRVGPEFALGSGRLALAATGALRWYGHRPHSRSAGLQAIWRRQLGQRAQLRADLAAAALDNRFNDLQDGREYRAALGLDRAFTPRTGGGIALELTRSTAADPAYAMAGGGVSAFAWREAGRATLVLSGSYSHVEADGRLALLPRRRVDDRLAAAAALTWRALRIGPFAPLLRVRWERNFSTLAIYDYRRLSAEAGLAAAL